MATQTEPKALAPSDEPPAFAYYINLDAQPNRRARMERLLPRCGLAARRVCAVTPADEAHAKLMRACDACDEIGEGHRVKVSPGMRANTLSHVAVWRDIVARAETEPLALVFEDDVMLLKEWRAELADCFARLPAGCGAPPRSAGCRDDAA